MNSLNQKRGRGGGGLAQCGVVLVSLAISDALGFDQMPARPQDHEAFSVLLVKICTHSCLVIDSNLSKQ